MEARTDSIQLNMLKDKMGLIHAFSTRHYKFEDGSKRDLNFGGTDNEENFQRHQKLFLDSLEVTQDGVFLVRQAHGNRIHFLTNPDDTIEQTALFRADAIVTHLENRPIGVLTADCIPVIVYDPEHRVVAVIHAGRKGTALKIFSRTIQSMRKTYCSAPRQLLAGMGPGICGGCYEVDESCIQPFREGYSGWRSFVENQPDGNYKLDLFEANQLDGVSAGMHPENILRAGNCTFCEKDRFYSYRREGVTGRMLTFAMLLPV